MKMELNYSNLYENNIYYKKYLKYKSKYLELIKNISNIPNIPNQIAGGYFYEQNDIIKRTNILNSKKFQKDLYNFSSIYLKANLTNPEITKKYDRIRKTILKNNTKPPHGYHLTLLIFEINLDYPIIANSIRYTDSDSNKFKVKKNLSFLDESEIRTSFELIFQNMLLTTQNYEILGKLTKIRLSEAKNKQLDIGIKNPETPDCIQYPGSYFVDKFEVNNKNMITNFRIKFYEKLNEFMKMEYIKLGGKEKNYVGYRADNESEPDYILIYYDNFSQDIPLMAIKKFYYGKNTWTPHISIFNMEELQSNNMKNLEKYIGEFFTSKNKIKTDEFIFEELKKNKTVKELFKKSAFPKITIQDLDFKLQI